MTFITKTIYWQQNILMIVKASFPTDFRRKKSADFAEKSACICERNLR
jgi:hypothetical protein